MPRKPGPGQTGQPGLSTSAPLPVEEEDRRGGDFARIIGQAGFLAWGRLNSGEIATLTHVISDTTETETHNRMSEVLTSCSNCHNCRLH